MCGVLADYQRAEIQGKTGLFVFALNVLYVFGRGNRLIISLRLQEFRGHEGAIVGLALVHNQKLYSASRKCIPSLLPFSLLSMILLFIYRPCTSCASSFLPPC